MQLELYSQESGLVRGVCYLLGYLLCGPASLSLPQGYRIPCQKSRQNVVETHEQF